MSIFSMIRAVDSFLFLYPQNVKMSYDNLMTAVTIYLKLKQLQ
ncbi:hypothetical protein M2444_002449 [Paenibacillus sp. PastF-3]|nr:hypothetical protein [Paenibacillus sp. PastF-3]